MTCSKTHRLLSGRLDGDLSLPIAQAVDAHLESCAACAARLSDLRRASSALKRLRRVEAGESIAALVHDRLELERRGPGLALLFQTANAARPMLGRSILATAAAALFAVGATFLIENQADEELPRPVLRGVAAALGTEANPMPPYPTLTIPTLMQPFPDPVLASMGEEGTLFVHTVVARDGHVSEVTLLEGDARAALPVLKALRAERFTPGALGGRPVAVSLYRLFSRMDVTPLT